MDFTWADPLTPMSDLEIIYSYNTIYRRHVMGIQEEEKKVLKLSLQTCKIRLVKYLLYICLWAQKECEDFTSKKL